MEHTGWVDVGVASHFDDEDRELVRRGDTGAAHVLSDRTIYSKNDDETYAAPSMKTTLTLARLFRGI